MTLTFLMFVTAAAVGWLPQQAPAHPNFSGIWRLDPAASVVAPPPGGAPGTVSDTLLVPIVVKQDAKTLALTFQPGNEPITFTYQLDGSTSTLPWPSGPGETVPATAVAKWDGDTLRIATHIPINGRVYDNKEAWSLVKGRLTIEYVGSRGKDTRVYNIERAK